nr:MAG TPA: Cytokine-induced anti-apoptosis inhibitor 1 [Caudoviricetes sp.]
MLNDAKPCQGCPVLGFCAASCSGSPKVQSSWDEQMTEAIIMLQI